MPRRSSCDAASHALRPEGRHNRRPFPVHRRSEKRVRNVFRFLGPSQQSVEFIDKLAEPGQGRRRLIRSLERTRLLNVEAARLAQQATSSAPRPSAYAAG